MKITKGQLRQIILEELEAVEEGLPGGGLGIRGWPGAGESSRTFDRLFEKGAPGDVFAEAVANELMLDEEEDFLAMRDGIQRGLSEWYRRHQAKRYPVGATPGADGPLREEDEELKTGQLTKTATVQRKAMMGGGINDKERAVISKVSKKLAAAAKKTNIMSGPVAKKIQLLATQIDRLIGDDGQAAPAEPAQPAQQQAQVQEVEKKRRRK